MRLRFSTILRDPSSDGAGASDSDPAPAPAVPAPSLDEATISQIVERVTAKLTPREAEKAPEKPARPSLDRAALNAELRQALADESGDTLAVIERLVEDRLAELRETQGELIETSTRLARGMATLYKSDPEIPVRQVKQWLSEQPELSNAGLNPGDLYKLAKASATKAGRNPGDADYLRAALSMVQAAAARPAPDGGSTVRDSRGEPQSSRPRVADRDRDLV